MLIRYTGSIGAGAIVTAALIYWMQFMIADRGIEIPPRISPPHFLISSVIVTPPPRHREPPPPPEPRELPPENPTFTTDLTTVPTATDRPAIPPGWSSPPTQRGGRQGPWLSDSDHMLVARVDPAYPYRALTGDIEGSVVVRFSIATDGSVHDVRVIESTHAMFERPAAEAVARSRYRPRIVDGVAVEVSGVTTQIEFRIED